MLPDYTYIPKTVVNHIHVGAVPLAGGEPEGFGSLGEPPYTFYHINKRRPIVEGIGNLAYGWNGTPFIHTLRSTDGSKPLKYKHFAYELRVNPEQFELLTELLHWACYLVDNRHCPDDQDHSIYVKQFWLAEFTFDDNLTPHFEYADVQIVFRDINTMPAI